jgi:hypothetical protein
MPHLTVDSPLYVLDFELSEGLASASQAGCRRFDPGLPLHSHRSLIHSALNDCAGSVDAARRAGTSPARHAAIASGTIALAKTEIFILVTS